MKIDSKHAWRIEVEVGSTKRGTHFAVAAYRPECTAFGAYKVWAETETPQGGEYVGEVATHFTEEDVREHLDSLVKALALEVKLTA